MYMHSAAVVAEQRLRHESHCLAVLVGDIAHDVLVQHHVVRRLHQGVKALIDLALAPGGDFVMMALDVEPALDHGFDHLGAKVHVVIGGRYGEVAFLIPGTVAQIVLRAAGVPPSFFGVDEVKPGVLILLEPDVVEDEELGFGPEKRRVRKARVLEMQLSFLGDPAGIALIVLPGDRVDDVAVHHQRGGFAEGVQERGVRIGNQEHVRFIDRRPAADGRTVDAEAIFEGFLFQLRDRIADVMGKPRDVCEAQIYLFGFMFFREIEHFFRRHGFSCAGSLVERSE